MSQVCCALVYFSTMKCVFVALVRCRLSAQIQDIESNLRFDTLNSSTPEFSSAQNAPGAYFDGP